MRLALFLVAALFTSASAVAADCEIDNWKASQFTPTMIRIEGTTTCPKARVILRVFEAGEGGAYLGNVSVYSRGYAFTGFLDGEIPDRVRVQYAVEARL